MPLVVVAAELVRASGSTTCRDLWPSYMCLPARLCGYLGGDKRGRCGVDGAIDGCSVSAAFSIGDGVGEGEVAVEVLIWSEGDGAVGSDIDGAVRYGYGLRNAVCEWDVINGGNREWIAFWICVV